MIDKLLYNEYIIFQTTFNMLIYYIINVAALLGFWWYNPPVKVDGGNKR